MDATTADKLHMALEKDDGAIEQALADLDVKLSAWSKAIHAAQKALKEQGAKQSTLETELSAKETELRDLEWSLHEQLDQATMPQAAASQAHVTAAQGTEIEEEAAGEAEGPAAEPESKPAEIEASAGDQVETPAVAEEVSRTETVGEEVPAGTVAMEAPRDSTAREEVPGAADSDEALLSALDEEAVKKIRVMHRLAPDKSLRELIEKHQAERAKEPASAQRHKQKKRKSWLGR